MIKSDSIKELAAALCKAQSQSDFESESRLVPMIANIHNPLKNSRGAHTRYEKKITRFMQRVSFGVGDCWYWRGRTEREGYGTFGAHRAHRVSYMLFVGRINKDKVIMHRCDVRNCVNPDHLQMGTQQENIADRDAKGRGRYGAKNEQRNGNAI